MRKFALVIVGLFILAACQVANPPPEEMGTAAPSPTPTTESIPVEVTRIIVTVKPSPTPAVCTPLPEGMTLTVTPVSDTDTAVVTLELTGLLPDEELYIIYRWESAGELYQIDTWDMMPVGEDGRYTETQNLRLSTEGPHTWQIKVIHARGVACTEITLPLQPNPKTAVPLPTSYPPPVTEPPFSTDLTDPTTFKPPQPTRTPQPTLTAPAWLATPAQPPPVGLIYGDSGGLWKVIADGKLQRLWIHGDATMSPNGQHALYQNERELIIADFTTGWESVLDLSFYNRWCCAVWGGDEMILLGTLPEGEEWQQSFGFLTAVAPDGRWQTVLDPENRFYTRPTLSPDGRTIAYGNRRLVQLNGRVENFDPTTFAGSPGTTSMSLGSPAWSPDGTKLAWYIAGGIGADGRHAAAVAVFDLKAETAVILHPYKNLGRDGWFAAPVWSPDGRWLAFNAEAEDFSQNGVWVAAADGSEEHFLGGLGGNQLVWSPDGRYLVYAAWNLPDQQNIVLMAETETWTAVPLDLSSDAVTVHWAAGGEAAVPPPPQVDCPDLQTDDSVGTLMENGRTATYANPVLGIEFTSSDKLCVHEPDYLFDSYGFSLADPDVWERVLLSVDWLYQAAPEQLETIVQQAIDNHPELDVQRENIAVDGAEGVMLWPLPGTEATTQIYLVANDRLYWLIFWSTPLDEQAQALLNGLRFVEPTQSLDSLNLPPAR